MKKENKNPRIRVAAQLTFSPKIISLVAEESCAPYQKGQVLKKITRSTLSKMERPLSVEVSMGGGYFQ